MYEIFTYGNGIMLGALFQAVAALTATPDYLELIRVIFMVTTLIVMIEIVWTGRFKATARLFTIILMMNAAILTTADVQITDRVNSANDSVVASVPAGLAAPLALATAMGDWATGAFETIFSMPNNLQYQTNGLLFSSRLVRASTQFEVTDSRMANNLAEFAQGCIYYGIMADWFSIEDVMESGDIWAALPASSFGNAIFVNYEDNAGTVTLDGCKNVRTKIQGDWAVAIDEMESIYGQRLFPEYAAATAKARLLSSLPQSYQFLANISDSAADIVRQNAMVNAMRRSFTNLANNAGVPGAAQDYALAQAEAQQRTTYSTLGALAGRMMSLFSNVLETLIYGIFPIAFVFTLIALMQGKAILMYFKLLFWLQLWPPMFAILNFAMSTYAADATTAAAIGAGGGASSLNMMTYIGMRAVNSDMSAMAGYLSWMIPMFSWAIVSGSGFAASQLAASLGSVAQSSGSAAAASAASGNISLGNYSAYNSRMFQENSSPSMNRGVGTYVNPTTGSTFTTAAGGIQTMSTLQNNTPIMANLTSSLKSSVGTSLNNAIGAARTSASNFMSSTGAAFNAMKRLSQSTGSGSNTATGWDQRASAQFSQDYSTMTKAAEQFAKANNLSSDEAVSILAGASLTTSAGFSLLGNGITLGGNGQLKYQGATVSGETWKAAQDFVQHSKFGEEYDKAIASAKTVSASNTQSSNNAFSDDISSSLSEQQSASSQLSSSLSNTSTWASLSSRLSDEGASGGSAAVGAFLQYAQNQGYSLQDLDSRMAAMSSTSGDAAGATREINALVAGFVQGQAGEMAGVDAAPSIYDSGIRQYDNANKSEIGNASASIVAQAQSNDGAVITIADQAGVPSAQAVADGVATTGATVESDRATMNQSVNTGKAQLNDDAAPMINSIKFNTDQENQHLLVNTLSNSADKAVDMMDDAKEAAMDMFGKAINE